MNEWYLMPGEDRIINLNALRLVYMDRAGYIYALIGFFFDGERVTLLQGTKEECLNFLRRFELQEVR